MERLGGSVWLSLRRLSLSEPLRLELRLGGQVQCLETRRPRAVAFAVEDLRARPLLELSLWDGLQEQCVASGRARLEEGKELVAQLLLNSGGRGAREVVSYISSFRHRCGRVPAGGTGAMSLC